MSTGSECYPLPEVCGTGPNDRYGVFLVAERISNDDLGNFIFVIDGEEKRVFIAGTVREVDYVFSADALQRQGLVFFLAADQNGGTFET